MRADLELELQHCRGLPSPPGVALRILQLAQDPDAIMATASNLIGMDAALSARMLRIANSPLYASRRRIENLSQALTILGLNATLTLALGFTLAREMSRPGTTSPRDRIWKRSVVAALAARLLGERVGLRQLEELMLAGLLQDIGVLALGQLYPEEYLPLLEQTQDNMALLQSERDVFGTDHAEIGMKLARYWNLPDMLCDAIGLSESDVSLPEFQTCIRLSGLIADIWLTSDTALAHGKALGACVSQLAMDPAQVNSAIEDVRTMLPDVCEIFDVHIPSPSRIQSILEEAKELTQLRTLRDVQEAARAREDADVFEGHARRLAEEVRRDPLTGIFNRAQLESVLDKEFDAAQRHGWPLSVAFIDLDDFKQVNDRWGHLVGDEVLRNFAQALQVYLRGSDIVARYGGEEFMIVLPGIDAVTASTVVRRILGDIARLPMTIIEQQPLHITFSAGLATQGGGLPFPTIEAMLTSADQALYMAKRDGRNRVVSA
ncbi:MAG: GGDEF domain-containing protein [Pseudoxanthomonas sp.]